MIKSLENNVEGRFGRISVFQPTKEKEERRCECSCQTQRAVTERKAVFCSLCSQKEVQEVGGLHYSKAIQVKVSARIVKCREDNRVHHHLHLLVLGCAL